MQRLAQLIAAQAHQEGKHPTVLDGVQLMRADRPRPLGPVLYAPCIVIIAQGEKRGLLGGHTYVYDANNYLVLSVPLPFECETFPAADGPLLGMSLRIDPAMLSELLLHLDLSSVRGPDRGIYATPLEPRLLEVAVRLAECLQHPTEARVLGPALRREILYRVLCGPQGQRLRHALGGYGAAGEISRVLQRLHSHCAQPFRVEHAAADLGMSTSAFHHAFKAITSTSPLQYLKSVRLHRARLLMLEQQLPAARAAEQVGYESVSQFSREYKRFFGIAPSLDTRQLQQTLGSSLLPPSS